MWLTTRYSGQSGALHTEHEGFPDSDTSPFDVDETTMKDDCLDGMQKPGSADELADIPLSLQEHLLDMYFSNFQMALKIVPEQVFREQKRMGQGPAYAVSLCLAMLAYGAQYSPMKDAVKPFVLPDGNTVFMERAKALLESGLRNATITTVQVLLILGDLEASRGKELSGSMYSSKPWNPRLLALSLLAYGAHCSFFTRGMQPWRRSWSLSCSSTWVPRQRGCLHVRSRLAIICCGRRPRKISESSCPLES